MGQKYDKAFVAAPEMGSAHGRDMFLVSWDRIIAALSVVLEVRRRPWCLCHMPWCLGALVRVSHARWLAVPAPALPAPAAPPSLRPMV